VAKHTGSTSERLMLREALYKWTYTIAAVASIPPEAMMHFLPVSDFPYSEKNFGLRRKFPPFYFFPKNFSSFIRQNFF